MALGIFIFIGIPEELLFRGIIQNLLEKAIGRPALALGVASLIFGAAHLNNGPSPDWRYFLLATLGRAGVRPSLRQNPQPDGARPCSTPWWTLRLARDFFADETALPPASLRQPQVKVSG